MASEWKPVGHTAASDLVEARPQVPPWARWMVPRPHHRELLQAAVAACHNILK